MALVGEVRMDAGSAMAPCCVCMNACGMRCDWRLCDIMALLASVAWASTARSVWVVGLTALRTAWAGLCSCLNCLTGGGGGGATSLS